VVSAAVPAGHKGLWLDETFSVWMASHSVADMLQWIVTIDQHPPLYYLLLHYWIASAGIRPIMCVCFLYSSAQAQSRLFT
jgi:uncharacterized membrane protein